MFVVFLSSVCCEFGVWLVVLAVDGCLLGVELLGLVFAS